MTDVPQISFVIINPWIERTKHATPYTCNLITTGLTAGLLSVSRAPPYPNGVDMSHFRDAQWESNLPAEYPCKHDRQAHVE